VSVVLFISVFLIAACGLIYELIAGTLASYLLGDSVLQFSTVIGSYLFAMGIGSFLSRYIARGLVSRFIYVELMVGLIGGFSSSLLFLAFAYTESFRLLLYALVLLIGTLVGLEIPLLMRILKERFRFRDLVAHVLTFDYLGALGASLLFPLLLVPRLGLVRSAMLFGLINAAVALWSTYLFRDQIGRSLGLRIAGVLVLAALGTGMVAADRIASIADDNLYADEVIFSRNTRYQRIVLTKWKDDIRLFLSSHLQFSSRDEYRYHEALVHPGLAAITNAKRVLVLGGGDGLAVREVLKYPSIEQVTLVDLDPEMTSLFKNNSMLVELNAASLKSPKVRIINEDAFPWLDRNNDVFDFVVVDFPDPTNFSLGKLYTTAFYYYWVIKY
jgi:spermidine synthase